MVYNIRLAGTRHILADSALGFSSECAVSVLDTPRQSSLPHLTTIKMKHRAALYSSGTINENSISGCPRAGFLPRQTPLKKNRCTKKSSFTPAERDALIEGFYRHCQEERKEIKVTGPTSHRQKSFYFQKDEDATSATGALRNFKLDLMSRLRATEFSFLCETEAC